MNDKFSIVNYLIVGIFRRIFKFVHSSCAFFRLGILFKISITSVRKISTSTGFYTEKVKNATHYVSYQAKNQKDDDQYQNQNK